jgi:hypothetical protein
MLCTEKNTKVLEIAGRVLALSTPLRATIVLAGAIVFPALYASAQTARDVIGPTP